LQRDIKRAVDTRQEISERMSGGKIKATPVDVKVSKRKKKEFVGFLTILFLVKVISHSMQRYAVWFGGSMLSSTPEFYKVSHQKKDYDEKGPGEHVFDDDDGLLSQLSLSSKGIARHNAVFGGWFCLVFCGGFFFTKYLRSGKLKERGIKQKVFLKKGGGCCRVVVQLQT
jgi:hypothetical protein